MIKYAAMLLVLLGVSVVGCDHHVGGIPTGDGHWVHCEQNRVVFEDGTPARRHQYLLPNCDPTYPSHPTHKDGGVSSLPPACGGVGEQCCIEVDSGNRSCNDGLVCDTSTNTCGYPPDMSVLPDLMPPSVPPDMSTQPDMTALLDMTPSPDMTCVPTIFNPTVELLIDRSASMTTTDCTVTKGTCPAGTTAGKCGGGKNAPAGCINNMSRWNLLKYALTDASVGVVYQLQSDVYFGAELFDTSGTTCPNLISSGAPALNNAMALQSLLASYTPSGNTPTALSVSATATYVSGLGGTSTKYIVLATDGLPNTCSSQTDDTANTVAAISAAYSAGIITYVLGVGPDTSDTNLQAMANAGQGVASGAVFYKGTSPGDLVSAFQAIINKARGCQ